MSKSKINISLNQDLDHDFQKTEAEKRKSALISKQKLIDKMSKKLGKQPNMTEKAMMSIQSHINRMQAVSSLERQQDLDHVNTINDLKEKLRQSIIKDDQKEKAANEGGRAKEQQVSTPQIAGIKYKAPGYQFGKSEVNSRNATQPKTNDTDRQKRDASNSALDNYMNSTLSKKGGIIDKAARPLHPKTTKNRDGNTRESSRGPMDNSFSVIQRSGGTINLANEATKTKKDDQEDDSSRLKHRYSSSVTQIGKGIKRREFKLESNPDSEREKNSTSVISKRKFSANVNKIENDLSNVKVRQHHQPEVINSKNVVRRESSVNSQTDKQSARKF